MTLNQPNFKTHFASLLRFSATQVVTSEVTAKIELSRTKQASYGDYSCNLAMHLAKLLHKNPREIAKLLIDAMPSSPYLDKAEVAGAGFINLFVKNSAKQQFPHFVLHRGKAYGHSDLYRGRKTQVEFVSANPTGPLHVGHGRGAAYGASIVNILSAVGCVVTSEYYVNDAGRQMDILTLSTWMRYLELHGSQLAFPGNAYQGSYVRDMARLIEEAHGNRYVHSFDLLLQDIPADGSVFKIDNEEKLNRLIANTKKILGQDYAYVHNFVLTEQLGDCRNDLTEFGVEFDTWFSEQSLFDNGLVVHTVELLEKNKYLYRRDGAIWFRSVDFGDEKDRVVQRENGQFTYFAFDMAYHVNKFERGFDQVINVWGADHHGYISRVKSAIEALKLDVSKLKIVLVQFAVLYRDGIKVSMSTRAGEFVTLRELRQEVGNDAARFFYVMRRSEQHLDFDLDLAKSQANDNPVYYIQYAHARICSVLKQWNKDIKCLSDASTEALTSPIELALLQKLIDFPDIIETAAKDLTPHLIAFYLRELASEFHSYYNATHFIVPEIHLQHARLVLVVAIQQVLQNGLALLGVSAPEKM